MHNRQLIQHNAPYNIQDNEFIVKFRGEIYIGTVDEFEIKYVVNTAPEIKVVGSVNRCQ